MRGTLSVALAAALVSVVAGCQDHKATPPTSTSTTAPSSPSSTPQSSTPTIDPQAVPAVEAYRKFSAAVDNAQRKPRVLGDNYAPEADFTKYSVDPVKSETDAFIISLSQQGVAYKGSPAAQRVTVAAINLNSKPQPTVTLNDCPTVSSNWRLYFTASGKIVPTVAPSTPAKAEPPYELEVVIVRQDAKWLVQKITPDTSRTCTG